MSCVLYIHFNFFVSSFVPAVFPPVSSPFITWRVFIVWVSLCSSPWSPSWYCLAPRFLVLGLFFPANHTAITWPYWHLIVLSMQQAYISTLIYMHNFRKDSLKRYLFLWCADSQGKSNSYTICAKTVILEYCCFTVCCFCLGLNISPCLVAFCPA